LQIDPALRIGAKENAQTQCRVYSDTAQAFDNFMDAPGCVRETSRGVSDPFINSAPAT
jgi:hypothetical protein